MVGVGSSQSEERLEPESEKLWGSKMRVWGGEGVPISCFLSRMTIDYALVARRSTVTRFARISSPTQLEGERVVEKEEEIRNSIDRSDNSTDRAVTVAEDGCGIFVSLRVRQRCYYVMKFGHCRYLHINPNGNVVYYGQDA